MRVTNEKLEISYDCTKEFFKKRANKYNMENPYAVTMYQDNNKELVKRRNLLEKEILKPYLHLSKDSKVLDIACGIGRWADDISSEISFYAGIDFSADLIEIAKKRNTKDNFFFYEGLATDIKEISRNNGHTEYNTILSMGILPYLNDKDLASLFAQMEEVSAKKAIICLREPIAIKERLTLKEFYSDELADNYNAIYRTREELEDYLETYLIKKGFQIINRDFLFKEDAMNNRKETAQYYYVLER